MDNLQQKELLSSGEKYFQVNTDGYLEYGKEDIYFLRFQSNLNTSIKKTHERRHAPTSIMLKSTAIYTIYWYKHRKYCGITHHIKTKEG